MKTKGKRLGISEVVLECSGKIVSWKMTLHETKVVYVFKSRNLYPLVPKGYPIETDGLLRGSNFLLP